MNQSSSLVLRPRQAQAIDAIRQEIRAGRRRVLLVAPTGFGKTIVIVAIAKGHLEKVPGGRVIIVVHRRELIKQTVRGLERAGLEGVGVLQAEEDSEVGALVVVASLQTLIARGRRPDGTLIIWDEAHHCPAASFRIVYAAYPNALHIGATATPIRSDERALGDVFEAMVVGASIRELTSESWLVPSEVIAPNDVLQDLSMHPVAAYQKHTPGRAAVVFCASVAHARQTALDFEAAGIRAACVDGQTSNEVRDDVLARFEAGELDVITNCFVLTEGWDCPRAEVCILARAPENIGTFLQMIGRVLRVFKGKRIATVIDLRGCVWLNGLPDEDRKWSLSGKACLRTEKITALRRCTECLAVFRPARKCPRCGATHEAVQKMPRVLRRAEKLEQMSGTPQHVMDQKYYWKLVGVAKARMRMNEQGAHTWATKTFRKQKGRDPEQKPDAKPKKESAA